jgi:hypothetical protein
LVLHFYLILTGKIIEIYHVASVCLLQRMIKIISCDSEDKKKKPPCCLRFGKPSNEIKRSDCEVIIFMVLLTAKFKNGFSLISFQIKILDTRTSSPVKLKKFWPK